jgi:hypothetical protein
MFTYTRLPYTSRAELTKHFAGTRLIGHAGGLKVLQFAQMCAQIGLKIDCVGRVAWRPILARRTNVQLHTPSIHPNGRADKAFRWYKICDPEDLPRAHEIL